MEGKRKAYSVQGDEFGTIRFAKHAVVARREGAEELGCDFNEISSCTRMPQLDSWQEKGGVPIKLLMENHGWHQECAYCCHLIYAETPGISWNEDETQSYCDDECHARHENTLRNWQREREKEEHQRAELIAAAVAKFPAITRVMADLRNGQVLFDFPGCTGAVNWKPGSKELWVNACDLDAWKAYRENHPLTTEVESS